jgi:hypothetical protein
MDATPTTPSPLGDGPLELTPEQIARVGGGSPKGTWIDYLCSPLDTLADLLASPKGTW